jgi:hypothetical protein
VFIGVLADRTDGGSAAVPAYEAFAAFREAQPATIRTVKERAASAPIFEKEKIAVVSLVRSTAASYKPSRKPNIHFAPSAFS